MCVCVCVLHCSVMSDSLQPWTVACQAPLLVEFPRQEYWSGLPFPPPGDLPNPGIKLMPRVSPASAGRLLFTTTAWEALHICLHKARHSLPAFRRTKHHFTTTGGPRKRNHQQHAQHFEKHGGSRMWTGHLFTGWKLWPEGRVLPRSTSAGNLGMMKQEE